MNVRRVFSSWLLIPSSLVVSAWLYLFLIWIFPMEDGYGEFTILRVDALCIASAAIVAIGYWSGRQWSESAASAIAWAVGFVAFFTAGLVPMNVLFGALPLVIWWLASRRPGPWLLRFALSSVPPLVVFAYVAAFAVHDKNLWPYTRFQGRLLQMEARAHELRAQGVLSPGGALTERDVAVLKREGMLDVEFRFPVVGFPVYASSQGGGSIWLMKAGSHGPLDPVTMRMPWASD